MSNNNDPVEPSMDQILASISQIIADDSEDAAILQPASHEVLPVMNAPVSNAQPNAELASLSAPAFVQPLSYEQPSKTIAQVLPVSNNPEAGSLTDRLANMEASDNLEMHPIPEAQTGVTPPPFMNQPEVSLDPVPVNMTAPQMIPNQPMTANGGFPVENAEQFLANNAQQTQAPVMQPEPQIQQVAPQFIEAAPQAPQISQPQIYQPEFSLSAADTVQPQQMAQPALQAAPEQAVVTAPAINEAVQSPIEQSVLDSFSQVEQTAQMQGSEMVEPQETAPVPPVMQTAETQQISLEPQQPVLAEAPIEGSLLDASYIAPTTPQEPLTAQPVMQMQTAEPVLPPAAVTAVPETVAEAPETMVQQSVETSAIAAVQQELSAESTSENVATDQVVASSDSPSETASLDSAIHAMVKPMVKDWLDENLSSLVEDIVRAELTSSLTKK